MDGVAIGILMQNMTTGDKKCSPFRVPHVVRGCGQANNCSCAFIHHLDAAGGADENFFIVCALFA
eukprot:scaffold169841_cov41-Prasinocladus_malaysianus.AAC.1